MSTQAGGCRGIGPSTPEPLRNRPGLPALDYRTGRWATFRESMLAGLAAPELAGLTTRDSDDFAVGLIDAWAMAADTLTFHTERIVEEQYLPTATERRSIADLTALIGYRLAPGVAASAWLAVTLETAPGAPVASPIPAGSAVDTVPGPGERPQTFETAEDLVAIGAWNRPAVREVEPRVPQDGDDEVLLADPDVALRPGDQLLFVADGWSTSDERAQVVRVLGVQRRRDAARVRFSPALDSGLGAGGEGVSVHALRARSPLFGHNAPDPLLLHTDIREVLEDAGLITDDGEWTFDDLGLDAPLAGVHEGVAPVGWAFLTRVDVADDNTRVAVSRVVPVDRVGEESRSAYAISARVTVLHLGPGVDADFVADFGGGATRSTVVAFASERLELAPVPITAPLEGDTIPLAAPLPGDPAPRRVLLTGVDPDGEPVAEVALVEPATSEAIDALVLAEPLEHRFGRAEPIALYGNVVPATHGRSVRGEVLGSGDGARAFQRFALRKEWVAHVRTPGGAESTLEVWVNGIRWREVRTLYGAGPRDRIYVTATDDYGVTTVLFGDGVTGARLPTGFDNVVAHYRTGIGGEGNAAAGRISLPLTRPLGLKAVTNPLPASGGVDSQSGDDARANAPRSMLTLGRVVSLQDYADHAADFPGCAKATATWTWDGAHRGILLTVAATDGLPIADDSTLLDDLRAGLRAAGDPRVRLELADYRPAAFSLLARLRIAPDHDPEQVAAAVVARLLDRHSFARRTFGEGVSMSGITRAIHEEPGVAAVRLDRLHRDDEPVGRAAHLAAAAPRPGGPPGADGAEILTLAAGGITVEVGW